MSFWGKVKNLVSLGPSKSELQTQIKSLQSTINEFGIDITNRLKFAGVTVTPDDAMTLDTVYACIRDKAESIGQLPGKLVPKNKDRKPQARLERIFTKRPNDYMTLQDLLENYVTSIESRGSWYAYPVFNKYGNVAEIIPFRFQQQVRPSMDANGRVYYTYSTNDGKPNITFAGGELIHIKLNSMDGINGLSPISSAARTVGIAISQEDYLANTMDGSFMMNGYLSTPNVFQDVGARDRLRNEWRDMHGGAAKAGEAPPLLEQDVKWNNTGISPADVELILQRKYSREQIAAIFRVPPGRVGIVDAMRFKNLEENNRSYLRDSLIPLITKFEFAMTELLPDEIEFKLDTKAFVRGDRKSQVEAAGQELKLGGISINEFREELDRDPAEGGDVHAIDTNNLTFGLLSDIPKLQEEARQLNAQPAKPNEVEENV